MKTIKTCGIVLGLILASTMAAFAEPSLTIYNQDFAVVRDRIELSLKEGENEVVVTDITAQAEPESVILRDPAGKYALRILEQNYRADPVSTELLLTLYEGQEIDFITESEMVRGRIIRSGSVQPPTTVRYIDEFYMPEFPPRDKSQEQPIIEVNGRLRFGLPGEPLFPSLKDQTILKPTLHWLIETEQQARFDAELCYVTGGMSWEADYNLIYPEKGDVMDLIGWVTMNNKSGKTFENARIKLMAGDISKIRRDTRVVYAGGMGGYGGGAAPAPVSEKTFDEYHLYTLNRRTTLRNKQTKQVEFVRAEGVNSVRLYVYDGANIDPRRRWPSENTRNRPEYGTGSNTKVRVMREFKNSETNNLGIPLPKGRVRFYRRDDDGQLEFTGENTIDHTPRDETVRVYTGNAFDLVGERRQVNFRIDNVRRVADESFEIKVRNRKENRSVEIRIVEHLYRRRNWEITKASHDYTKTDSQAVEFRVTVDPDKEEVVTYTVHYTW